MFRRALDADNIAQSNKGVGEPQVVEVNRMLAAARNGLLDTDRPWQKARVADLARAEEGLYTCFEKFFTDPKMP